MVTLDEVKLPDALLTNRARYLDKLNFATNFVFFRDADGLSTRLVSANYWSGYGGGAIRLWLRLFDAAGGVLATWQQEVPAGPGGFSIDSRTVRERFGLPAFTGQLFVHAIGAAGHDVVKYALDTYAADNGASLSCTHDANAWPSDRYAGLPAPRDDETRGPVAAEQPRGADPAGAVALDRMGAERPVAVTQEVGPFATVAVDVAHLLPELRWPAQIELRAGRHVVRPRYEVTRGERVRIAHVNVERGDLRPDPAIAGLPAPVGARLSAAVPRAAARALPQHRAADADGGVADARCRSGSMCSTRRGGRWRNGSSAACRAITMWRWTSMTWRAGHAELVYDFRDGGEADGWLHALFRYEDRQSGHVAESSFGAHIFNTVMTYRDEPQSYTGPPPGLTTRLFLKLGDTRRRSFAVLIYPASAPWHAHSATALLLHDGAGEVIAEQRVAIACSGSTMVWPHVVFGEAALRQAGPDGYVLVRDTTCRLFGYHGLMDDAGGFSLDHMFGF